MSTRAAIPVLALNAGSSSLKFGLFEVGPHACRSLLSGMAERGGAFSARAADGTVLAGEGRVADAPQDAVARIAELLEQQGLPMPAAIGHRIVHGGPHCRRHTLIDAAVMQQLQAATVYAPLHAPAALALLRSAQAHFPGVAQVACLDTAFHASLPQVARTLPIPRELRARGIERYGFHGLSCESIVRQLGEEIPQRLLIAHLGHGASVTAVADGRSVDTSMGLTPSGGVMMSTRCGDIDPGVLVHVAREFGYDATQLEALVDTRSGLLGVSGISDDMRALRTAAAASADARLAIAMFCYSVRKQIGAMATVLGGLDLLVFTGGIGEHDAATRIDICAGLQSLGIRGESDTAVPRSNVRVLPAQEGEQIARHSWQLVTRAMDAGTGAVEQLAVEHHAVEHRPT